MPADDPVITPIPVAAGPGPQRTETITVFERRLYFHIDWLLLGAILLLTGISIAMIYSTTYVTLPGGGHAGPQVRTQVYALVIGIVALLVFLSIDYRMLAENSLFLYAGLCALLLFVLIKGSTQMGAQRWIPIGPFNLQPSEFGARRHGADPGDVLRREPARRPQPRRPADRRPVHGRAAAAHRAGSRTSAPR